MKINTRLFRSILAQRIFLLFVVSALVPTVILAFVAYRHVSGELLSQSEEQMHRAVKAESLSVYERLLFLEAELESTMSSIESGREVGGVDDGAGERIRTLFEALAIISAEGDSSILFGDRQSPPKVRPEQLRHLEQGRTVLTTVPGGKIRAVPVMLRLRDPADPGSDLVAGTVSTEFLWGAYGEKMVLPGAELCVFDESRRLIYSSFTACSELAPLVVVETSEGVADENTVEVGGERFLAGVRNLFLRPRFMVQDWAFVLCEPETQILAPMRGFQRLFPPVVLSSLWIVLLLSIYTIRRSLVPLDRLAEGTERVAAKDFSTRVEVSSGDEFEDLATAFNDMSDHLRRQFKALATNAAMHRTILSSLDTATIIDTAVAGTVEAMNCDLACIALRAAGDADDLSVSCAARGTTPSGRALTARLSPWDLEMLSRERGSVVLSDDGGASGLRSSLPSCGDPATVVAFPIRLSGRLAAVLCIARYSGPVFSEEELTQARQLTDQVELAISNSSLVEELRSLTWGTLEAFARAIDAKSAWTAGHSERVTRISLKIARVMGLPKDELEVLHRGALLHDVGKLGISMKVLNKPGRLERNELDHVRTHAQIGGRILAPISAFADIMPIVTEHHEKYDGTGYPKSLAGEEIDLKARILAVADTYDAMTSKRPYRERFSHERAVAMVCEESGTQFDPKVIEAFLVAMNEDPRRLQNPPDDPAAADAAGGRA